MTPIDPRPGSADHEAHAYPVLPLRGIVVFPHMIFPLFVGHEKAIRAIAYAMKSDARIVLATQKDDGDDDPLPAAMHDTATLAIVQQLFRLSNDIVKLRIAGLSRVRVETYSDRSDYYEATASCLPDTDAGTMEAEALARSVVSDFMRYAMCHRKIPPDVVGVVQSTSDFARLADIVASHLAIRIADRLAILGTLSVVVRLEKVLDLMN